ncbi:MAG: hydantoinase B/oxoprolinase family protein [Hyphomicrobiaceae bacterium]|nr:hydantoinase B/oxoprolinase family protein [Hyphomicrobiaceae bacterium]
MSNDPITEEIIQNSLQAIADEMFAAFRKTAMSSIIYEVLDLGTGVLNKEGELACTGAGIPAFIGMLDKGVKAVIARHPNEGQVNPGDIFATNDPYYGGVTHLNDIIVIIPVFAESRLVAWTANIAHNSDVGGMAPGSLSGDATEIFQEGLRLPAIKIVDRGEPIAPVMDIIKTNSRMPDVLEGDLWAAIASARIGANRLTGLIEKYGLATFENAMKNYLDHGEMRTRAALADLPKGTFELSEEQDDGRVFNVKVTIADDGVTVDLRDNPEQGPNPMNASRDAAVVAAQMMYKALTDPLGPTNDGAFRPLEILTKEGTIFHAKEPAAIGFYYELILRTYDLIWRCLAPHVPGRLPAGHFGSIVGTFISGVHADNGRYTTIIEPQIGGWGANQGRDGVTAMFSGIHGETYNCPAEINEARNGLTIDQLRLNDEQGGEGEFNGGRGIVLDYRIRAAESVLTGATTRSKYPPWALNGGHPGTPNSYEIIRTNGDRDKGGFFSNVKLTVGDVIRIRTANGGGYGDPKNRSRDAVREDVRNGLISAERAEEIYGPF